MYDSKHSFFKILLFLFSAVFLLSAALFTHELLLAARQKNAFEQLRIRLPPVLPLLSSYELSEPDASDTLAEDTASSKWKAWWEEQAKSRFSVYQQMQQENPHMAGWIHIENTSIDYPVCHTPDQPDYYLHRDFTGKKSSGGTPYLDACCRLDAPRTNLLIYGHHMKNGAMFAPLQNYTDPAWLQKHPYIQFDTTNSAGTYEVAAVILLDHGGVRFPWQQLLFPDSESDFNNAWKLIQSGCIFSSESDLTFEEELLALVTCEYTREDGRLMVVARRIL